MRQHVILSFFFNDTATTEIYTLSLHDALPIYEHEQGDVLSAQITTTNQSTTEIDGATASLSKLQNGRAHV